MSNLDFQCSRVAPSKVGGVGTARKFFPRSSATAGASGLFFPAGVNQIGPVGTQNVPNVANATGSLWVPANPSTDGRQLHVQASGTVTEINDPSGTVTVALYVVTGQILAPIYTSVASTGAIIPSFGQTPWALDATLTADGVSRMLIGHYTAVSTGGALNGSPKGIDSIVTGVNFAGVSSTGETLASALPPVASALPPGVAFGLVVGVTFGTSDSSNTATMTQFSVES
jgi:hypothetical protein